MRNNGTGGMQSASACGSIYCEKCGKASPLKKTTWDGTVKYLHFTKSGSLWHICKDGVYRTERIKHDYDTI